MWFTKNEKAVLKLLLNNSKMSDTDIAKEINISTQAIGRIRKRLEEEVIKKYSVELDKKALGIDLIVRIKIKFENLTAKDAEEVEKKLRADKNIFSIFKLMSGEGEYLLVAGFKDMNELKTVIEHYKKEAKMQYSIKELIPLHLDCLLKSSFSDLYNKMIDTCGTKHLEEDNN